MQRLFSAFGTRFNPMFYIHQSNHMALLARQLCGLISQVDNANPFAEEVILVQSPGMSQWLKINLAQQLGIMANIEFPLPSSFIWSLYNLLIKDLPEQSAFNKDKMSWKLYSILPEYIDDDNFTALKHYLEQDNNGLMQYQLCEKIADVFDQYLMYRPDWIETWEAGQNDVRGTDVSLHPWQPILWRALTQYKSSL